MRIRQILSYFRCSRHALLVSVPVLVLMSGSAILYQPALQATLVGNPESTVSDEPTPTPEAVVVVLPGQAEAEDAGALPGPSSRGGDRPELIPTATPVAPSPTATPVTPSPTATLAPSPSPTRVVSPTVVRTATPRPTQTPLPRATPTVAPTPAPPAAPVQAPPSAARSIYWGAWVQGPPWDMNKQAAFEAMSGKGASIMHWGQAWKSGGKYQPFYPSDFDKVRAHGSIPLLDWSSWNLGSGIKQPDFQLAQIANGAHDDHIRNWATGAKNWGKPFFLRFNWEMNGNWFPWGEKANGNQPGDYVRAWRHVVDIFRSVGATNVKWVWCPNTDYSGATPLASLYPGDAYVDWVGIDGYNWAATRGLPWLSFTQVFKPTYDQLGAIAPSKPVMIPEFASEEDGGPRGRSADKAAWIRSALLEEVPGAFARIKALVWFNWSMEGAEWEVTSPESRDAWRAGITSGYYLGSNNAGIGNIAVP